MKKYKLTKDLIRPIVQGYGACFASDMITVDGHPVRFMYRESPDNRLDSGWRFMSGFESDEYVDNPDNIEIYDVNTIANYDQSIISLLDSPIGCAFEKSEGSDQFQPVSDWNVENR
ncbi:DUF2185 domain-containing protein [Permianibacter fluminis]|uniref:DUF2185 domain-containing protein n=1 Tax=Permianibacter fluminis TaxID=2738515 RepID=UPI001B7D7CE5|nr:DUF2185 domain-containing protein [Permianibacter fluminis]